MIKNEFIKLFSNRVFIFSWIILLLINVSIIWWDCIKTPEGGAAYERYITVYNEIKNLPDTEQENILTQKMQEVSDIQDELYKNENVDYIIISNTFGEYMAYKEVLTEIQQSKSNLAGTGNIVKNAQNKLKSLQQGNFEYRKYEEIIKAYKKVSGQNYTSASLRSLRVFTNDWIVDLTVIALGFVGITLLLTGERDAGLTILSKTTRNGRIKHAFCKYITVLASVLIFFYLLNVVRLLVVGWKFDLAFLTAPAQQTFYSCPVNVSTGWFLLICMVLKIPVLAMIVGIFFLICLIARKNVIIALSTGALMVLMIFAAKYVSPVSYLVWIRYINPVNMLNTDELFHGKFFINLFSFPVDRSVAVVIGQVIAAIMLLFIALAIYSAQEEREKSEAVFSVRLPGGTHTSIFGHELFKLGIVGKGAIVLGLTVFLAIELYAPVTDNVYSIEDYLYRSLATNYVGKYEPKTLADIKEKKAYWESRINPAGTGESYAEKMVIALDRAEKYARYLSEKKNGYYIENKGFSALTGGDYMANIRYSLGVLLATFAAICIGAFSASVDEDNDEIRLINATKYGRTKSKMTRSALEIVGVVTVFAAIFIPQVIQCLNNFGTEYLFTAASNIQMLQWVPDFISIAGIIVLKLLGALMYMIIALLLAVIAEKKVKNPLPVILMLSVILGLPVVLI